MSRGKFMAQYNAVRPGVLARDGSACVKCGHAVGLETHHVNGYTDFSPANIRTLCYFCHNVAPMGDEYWDWERDGVDGWTQCEDFIVSRLPQIDRCLLRLSLEAVEDYRSVFRIFDAQLTRKEIRVATGRCEGRKPFGTRPGEAEAIAFMRQYRSAGETFASIADLLNKSIHKTRTGKPWIGAVVCKILARS